MQETHLRELAVRTLEALNAPTETSDAIGDILVLVREFTGIEAVGIRLHDGEDYPYYEYSGFPESFIRAESCLCARDTQGHIVHDGSGYPVLECMCGNVIRGRTDPSYPFFTDRGSFWSNCTTELLASTTEEERQVRTRNRCNGVGYESVALVPLRADGSTVGLLQLNDHRTGVFTPELIEFCERLGASVGIALERKQAEVQLRSAHAELERRNEELSAFARSLSHDLRGPLRAIDGFSQILQEDFAEQLDDRGQGYVMKVRDSAQQMQRLVDAMLQLSRVSQAPIAAETVDLSALAREIDAELRHAEPDRRVEFTCADGLRVSGDTALLRAALRNLLDNARKFTRKEPAARIEFGAKDDESGRAYFVRDNGAGFDMARAGELFGVFKRLHSGDDYPGTGIGLATVKTTIQRHGGRVWAEAVPGLGATFYFTVPACVGHDD